MKQITTLIFLTLCLSAIAQTTPTRNWVDTEVNYTDSLGNTIKVYNSLPRGGGRINSGGKDYSYVVFWSRIINESPSPLKLSMHFPSDSFAIFPSPSSYIKLSIPSDTMTFEKIQMLDYGLTNLKGIFEKGNNKASMLQKTLLPNEECYFYIPVFFHQASGTSRAALVLKSHEFFYRLSIDPHSVLIPCGRLDFEK